MTMQFKQATTLLRHVYINVPSTGLCAGGVV